MRSTRSSLSSRLSSRGKNSMTTGSAFISANGARSASRHRRSRSRGVRSSVGVPVTSPSGSAHLVELVGEGLLVGLALADGDQVVQPGVALVAGLEEGGGIGCRRGEVEAAGVADEDQGAV